MEAYKNQSLTFEERAADLVSRMTLEEKISQLGNNAAAIPRLGVARYDYWSEASHGFFGPYESKQMDVTSFPVGLAMSQSWDETKVREVASAISDECRAHHNLDGIELHMWCPTINLARDPRNGRSDENWGEDPFLAGHLAAAYIQGMQGDDPKYLKTVATPKHFALNSSENNRHTGSAWADEATIREYYAKVFEYAVKEGRPESIMTSYNRVCGVPSSANEMLLTTLLREEWGFNGFVVSDCGAVADTYYNPMYGVMGSEHAHYYCKSMEEASAVTLSAGTDMSCGSEHKKFLKLAVEDGLVTEDIIDQAAIRVLTSRFRLGLFDDATKVSYNSYGREHIDSEYMRNLSEQMAEESIVLLKNDDSLLPLDIGRIKSILVVGPNAIYRELGGYSAGHTPSVDTTVNILALAGIKDKVKGTDIEVRFEKGWCTGKEQEKASLKDKYALPGFDLDDIMVDFNPGVDGADGLMGMGAIMKHQSLPPRFPVDDPDKNADDKMLIDRAVEAARRADVVIVIAGTDSTCASEEHDRDTLELPYGQNEKINRIIEVNPHTVVVITALGAVTGSFIENAHTVVNAHFAGQAQGTAIARVLFGDVNPSGKLSATWYRNTADLPHINDYGIKKNDTLDGKSRTYMYFEAPVLFPFGYGLSYTTFQYSNLTLDKSTYDANDKILASVDVSNVGQRDGVEIVQLYIGKMMGPKQHDNKPIRQLKGFQRVALRVGETKHVTIEVPLSEVTFWNNCKKKTVIENGSYKLEVGASSADLPCTAIFNVTGNWKAQLSSVYADVSRYVLAVGESSNITSTATLEDTTRLRLSEYAPVYTSSNPGVAAVNADGVITGISPGTAAITVSYSYGGKSKSVTVGICVK